MTPYVLELTVQFEEWKEKEAREIFDEETISELTGESLLNLSQTEGDQVVVGYSGQGAQSEVRALKSLHFK